MMAFDIITYEIADQIATITLNRPEKLNAYTPEMGEEIVSAFNNARDNPQVRVVILTGKGRAYCAGVDLNYLKAHRQGENPGKGPKLGEEHFVQDFPVELLAFPKPVIAAINGPAYGVGVTMTLGCDVRLASEDATFGLNFASLGVLPGLGSTHLLPQLVGTAKALELVLAAATIDALEAEKIGLVQHVVAKQSLLTRANELAGAMLKCEPKVLTAAKKAIRHGATADLTQSIAMERKLSAELAASRQE